MKTKVIINYDEENSVYQVFSPDYSINYFECSLLASAYDFCNAKGYEVLEVLE